MTPVKGLPVGAKLAPDLKRMASTWFLCSGPPLLSRVKTSGSTWNPRCCDHPSLVLRWRDVPEEVPELVPPPPELPPGPLLQLRL